VELYQNIELHFNINIKFNKNKHKLKNNYHKNNIINKYIYEKDIFDINMVLVIFVNNHENIIKHFKYCLNGINIIVKT